MPSTTAGSGKRRADAERSIAAITDAALDCFRSDPHTGMAAIARAAGVSRVTLYAHFPTREALLEAALDRALAEASAVLAAATSDNLPADEGLLWLIRSSWQLLDRHSALFTAVSTSLDPVRMREHHERALAPVRELLLSGRWEGAFRTDLGVEWLVTVFYSLIHAAAAEVQAGRLAAADVPDALAGTLLPAMRPQHAG
jgi:AcrR family transcriptional regulator